MTVDELVHKLTLPMLGKNGGAQVDLRNTWFLTDDLVQALEVASKSYDFRWLHGFALDFSPVTEKGVLAVVEYCPQLRYLGLAQTQMTDAVVRVVAERCPKLQVLSLWDSQQVTDVGVQALARYCTGLQRLSLHGTGVTDAGVRAIAKSCSGLIYLDLSGPAVTVAGLKAVGERCLQLRQLALSGPAVTNDWVQVLAQAHPPLQYLDLSRTRVTDVGVRVLVKRYPLLQTLHLEDCEGVTDASVRALADGCPQLQKLYLRRTGVIGVDSTILATFDAQQIFAALIKGVLLSVARIQFLGSASVGKTWLFERCFLDRCVERTRPRAQTPDIDLIRPEQCVWRPNLRTLGSTLEVEPRVWDFGGQLVLHGLHEAFLKDDGRTVYVLVLSANVVLGSRYVEREETGNAIAYWRRMIAHFGSNSAPVVVAVTQCDKAARADRPIDRPTPIHDALAGLTLIDDLSACDPDRPIQPLRDAIEAALVRREGIRQGKVSPELKAVREIVVRELPKVALVPMATFHEWCRQCNVPDQQVNAVRDALHYMGCLFYFGRDRLARELEHERNLAPGQQRLLKRPPDTVLSEFVINPVWLKHAAYRVFEESERSEWFSPDTLQAKVQDANAMCADHPRGRDVIEAFLKWVELSFFDEEKQQYLLPRGLKSGLPPGSEDWPTARLHWEFVPESAFHRFVVRMHHRRQVASMGGGYAHGRDWVMVQHDGCRVAVSADSVNGVVEVRFDPNSVLEDRRATFATIRHDFTHDFIGKLPTREEGMDQPQTGETQSAKPAMPSSLTLESPAETWRHSLIGPGVAATVVALLASLYLLGVNEKVMGVLVLFVLVFFVVYLMVSWTKWRSAHWPKPYMNTCLTAACVSAAVPSLKLVVDIKEGGKLEGVIDNAPWVGIGFLAAAVCFGVLQVIRERGGHHQS